MKIRKETPTWYIIGDTKLNAQSFQKYTEHVNADFENLWIKANGKAQTVSQAEKMLEALAFDFLGLKNEKSQPNNEFIVANFSKLEQLFSHFSVTIVFDEVSHQFLENVLLQKLDLHINQKRYSDMSLWLPPAFEHPIHSTNFGRCIGDICGNIDNFITECKRLNVSEEDALKAAFSLLPAAQHCKCVVTATMSAWRGLLINLSQPHIDIETRYIILHLLRDLKMRYFGFFCDLALQSTDGKIFGADSINNEGFWKNVRIVKKP